ncbi:hypothetical protein ET495_06165 [Xylanimonas allomyrinae]|uniref:Uncharacterized protein n=1 Tax=Xylanimonas allomyrinae TaxID=2509459 RepID=A0A4P6EXW9_9MICO|nr:hypothetical protein [Xylanimonas allomyrinae]QAY62898.1 hypothetical protein ET495_06165 [Xylanimonas allomyrinae]
MSRRDAKRARRAGSAADLSAVPLALSSRRDPLWSDAEAVERLATQLGLVVDVGRPRAWVLAGREAPTLAEAHPWLRFDAFRSAWCLAAGLGLPERVGYLDRRRCQAASIDTSSSRWDAPGRGCQWAP